jgi:hypothetical protein
MEENRSAGWIILALIIFGPMIFSGIVNEEEAYQEPYIQGDMSNTGGSATIRNSFTPEYEDDPFTTNDESNDQPVGFYGTETMYACNGSSGNCYDLDVDSDGESVERLYFPNGGWVDVEYSDCDDGYCLVEDENGTEWELEY